uniref:Phosphatidylinositol N-acetylglucosaminyltransferase subunit H conserved domain-containing protein n=1 Tax=Oryza barthii TaxID=65489 RepID=A0A0D3G3N1_9ORYZ
MVFCMGVIFSLECMLKILGPSLGACRGAGAAQRRLRQGRALGATTGGTACQAGSRQQVRPWNKNGKEKFPLACILTIIILTVGLMSMKSMLRGADSGFCCHTLAWFSFSQEGLSTGSVWSIAFGILVAKCLQYKPVKKESVVIMPTFGVQLEIHFWSGRVHRRFVPIGKILKPLLNECVTPVTCYWSLALLLRDEEELRLVFQKSHPPVKMLVPVWKALCKFLNSGCQTSSAVSEPNRSET